MQTDQLNKHTSKVVNLFKTYESIRSRHNEGKQVGRFREVDYTSRLEETTRLLKGLSSRQVQLLRLRDTWGASEKEQLQEVIDLVDRLKRAVESIHACQWQVFQLEQQEKLCGHPPDAARKALIREDHGRVLEGCWSRS